MQDEYQPKQRVQAETPDNVPEPSSVVMSPSPKSKNKLLVIILAVVVLLGGAAAVYFLMQDKDPKPQNNSGDQATVTSAPDDALYFQVDTKLYAYETDKKTAEVIYDKLPASAEVLDFYWGEDGWRAYYILVQDADAKLYFVDNGTETLVVEITDNYPITAANAEARVLAYSILPGVAGQNETTSTYIVNGTNGPELVYESDAYKGNLDDNPADLKNAHYHLSELSPDAKQILFSRSLCYQCDGASPGYFAEFDIDSKQMTAVELGTVKAYRNLKYARDGSAKFYLNDSDDVGLLGGIGDYEGFDTRISRFTDPAQKTLVFEESNDNWAGIGFSPDYSLAAVNVYEDPSDWQSEYLQGLYEAKGTTKAALQKREVPVPEGVTTGGISNEVGSCMAMVTSRRADSTSFVSGIAVTCRDNSGVYDYELIAETVPSQQYLVAKLF